MTEHNPLEEALDRQGRMNDPVAQAQRRQALMIQQVEGDESTLRKLLRVGEAGIEGFNQGLAQILAAPTDIINFLLSKAGIEGSERFLGSSQALIQNMEALGISATPSQETFGERIAGRVGQEVGASVPVLGLVGRTARTLPIVAPTASKLLDPILRPAVTAPGRTAAVETGLAVTAGAGGAAALEVTEEAGPGTRLAAEITGQLVGGIAPTGIIGAARGVAKGVRSAIEPFTEAGIRRRGATIVQKSTVDVDAALRRLEDLPAATEIPDAEFTPGQITGDPALLSLERSIIRSDAQNVGAFKQIEGRTNRALRGELRRTLDPGGERSAPGQAIQERVDRVVGALNDRAEQAIDIARRRLDDLPEGSKADASEIVRDELNKALKDARAQERALWQNLPGFQVAVVGLRDSVIDRVARLTKGADPEDIPKFVRERLIPAKKDETVSRVFFDDAESAETLLDFRSQLLDKGRTARAAGEFNKARILGEIAEDVRLTLDEAAETASPQFRTDAIAARTFSKELNDKFTRGPVGKVLGFDSAGGVKVDDVETLSKLLRPGEPGRPGARQLIKAAGGNQRVEQAASDFIAKTFRDQVVDSNGLVNPAAAQRFLVKHEALLSEFPEAKALLEGTTNAQRTANAIGKSGAKRSANINNVNRSRAALFLDGPPETAMKRVLASKNPGATMRELVRQAKKDRSGKALKGLQTLFADEVLERAVLGQLDDAGEQLISARKLREFFNPNTAQGKKNIKILGELYDGPEQAKGLVRVIEAANLAERSINASLRGGSDTAQNFNILSSSLGRIIGARIGSKVPGLTPLVTAGIGGRVATRILGDLGARELRDLISRAVVDPEVMKTLLMTPTKQNEKIIRRRLHAHLVNLGGTSIREDAGDEKSTATSRPSPPPNRARASTPTPVRQRPTRPQLPPPVTSPARRGLGDALQIGPLQ